MSLAEQTCEPCRGGTPPMRPEEARNLLAELGSSWSLNQAGHLTCEYSFPDFAQALRFANVVGDLAEQEGHHPDLHVTWGKCGVEIWTHKVQGLTRSDFVLAAKVERSSSSAGTS